MPSVKQVIFKQAVRGAVQKDQDLKVESVELDLTPPANGVTLKTLFVSLDPYMKGRMRAPETKSYNTTFEIDKPIVGGGLSEVVESNDPNFPKGTIVSGMMSHSEYYHVEDMKKAGLNKLQNPHNLPVEKFLGVLGMPGLTAYASLYDIGAPKSGETIFVSAASGAVGSLVGQLAKREGLRVIGSAGSDEKVAYLKETLKFDEAFNYKTEEPAAALARLAPEGIDIYYDNVGGPTLDAAINAIKVNGRIVACGAISQYNNSSAEESYGVKNMVQFVSKRLLMKGFIISDMWGKWYPEFIQKVGGWVADGQISYKEDIYQGIDSEIDAFIGMLVGKNFGKVVIAY